MEDGANGITYHKLVRDRIPEIVRAAGKQPVYCTVGQAEALEYLAKKLMEEAQEYAESREVEELADVLEVVYAIAAERGVTRDELEKLRKNKADQRGGFAGRIVLEKVITP
ncbi:MAG: nucleoside triphosphate pyrophosphohydrolase [Clostridia bacterium]|nr:nucleoside triphosphate pyrophosphohydrolase [Clostridia bacterium]